MLTFQWTIIRIVPLILILSVLVDDEILMVVFGFLLLHINVGLKVIVHDYIHFHKIKLILLILLRVSSLEVSRYILELFI